MLFELEDLLLRQQIVRTIYTHLVQIVQSLDALANGLKIRKRPSQPSLGNVKHTTTFGLLLNHLLGLLFRPHEYNGLSPLSHLPHYIARFLNSLGGFLEIYNVDPIPLHKDELLHLGIPPSGLMPEMNARFKKLTYRYDRHFIPPRASVGFRRLRLFSGGTQSGTSSENREACELKVKRSLLSFATKTRRYEVLPILEVFSVPLCLGGWSVIFRSHSDGSSLGELVALPGAGQPVFLSLLHPGIPSQKARLF